MWYTKKQRYSTRDKCDTGRNKAEVWVTSVVQGESKLQCSWQSVIQDDTTYNAHDKCDTWRNNITVSMKSVIQDESTLQSVWKVLAMVLYLQLLFIGNFSTLKLHFHYNIVFCQFSQFIAFFAFKTPGRLQKDDENSIPHNWQIISSFRQWFKFFVHSQLLCMMMKSTQGLSITMYYGYTR